MKARPVALAVEGAGPVSALWLAPRDARAAYVFAHGAGAGMAHPFMASVSEGLADRRIASLRFQFPYMERGSKRPDAPPVAMKAVRAAVAEARRLAPDLALYAGGKSFGGRMTSQAQASSPLPGVRGLAFFGFPLHAAGRPSDARGKHLAEVGVPMLFLQGTRDALADGGLMRALCRRLGRTATLELFDEADHSFHVPARTGRSDPEVLAQVLDAFSRWIETA